MANMEEFDLDWFASACENEELSRMSSSHPRQTISRMDSVMSDYDVMFSIADSDSLGLSYYQNTGDSRQWQGTSGFSLGLTTGPTLSGYGTLPTPLPTPALTEVTDTLGYQESDDGDCCDTPKASLATQLCSLGTTKVDPFCPNTSQCTSRQMDALLSHFAYVVTPAPFKADPSADFRPLRMLIYDLARQDHGAIRALLSCAAMDIAIKHGRKESKEAIAQKLASIHSVNQRLSNRYTATRDQTMIAIAANAGLELMYGILQSGRHESYTRHMDGLQQIVDLRGGIESLRASNPSLALLVLWLDYAGSCHLISRRRFPLQHSETSTGVLKTSTLQFMFRHWKLPACYDLCEDCTSIVQKLFQENARLRNPLQTAAPASPMGSEVMLQLDADLWESTSSPPAETYFGRRLLIRDSVRLGALIYLVAMTPPRVSWIAKSLRLVGRLKETLLSYHADWCHTILSLLWILLGNETKRMAEVEEGIRELMVVSVTMTSGMWREVRDALMAFLLDEEVCEGLCQDVWRQRTGWYGDE